jgi:hypothetical protein
MYLHGHDHSPNVEESNTLDGRIVFIPAGASYDGRNSLNSYSYQIIDLVNRSATIFFRRYDSRNFRWHADSSLAGNINGIREIDLDKIRREEVAYDFTPHPSIPVLKSFLDRKGDLIQQVTQTTVNPVTMNFGFLVGPKQTEQIILPLSEKWVQELGWLAPGVNDSGVYNEYISLKHRVNPERSGPWGGYIWPTGHLQIKGEFVPKKNTLDIVEVASIILAQTIFIFKVLLKASWRGELRLMMIIRDIGTRELQAFYDKRPHLYSGHTLAPESDRIIYEVGRECQSIQEVVELCMDLVVYIAKEFAFDPSYEAKRTIRKHASKDIDLMG